MRQFLGPFSSLFKLPRLSRPDEDAVPDLPVTDGFGGATYGEPIDLGLPEPPPRYVPPAYEPPDLPYDTGVPSGFGAPTEPPAPPKRTWIEEYYASIPPLKSKTPPIDLSTKLKAKTPTPPASRPAAPLALGRPAEPPAADNEAAFRQWYAAQAKRHGLSPDPDDPKQYYDYRGAYAAGATPDKNGHWPSTFKRPGHPNEVVGGFNTRTGARVPGTPRASEAELIKQGWDPKDAARMASLPEPAPTPQQKAASEIIAGFDKKWATPTIPTITKQTEQEKQTAERFRLRTPEEEQFVQGAKTLNDQYQAQINTHAKAFAGLGAQIAKQKPAIDKTNAALTAEGTELDARAAALLEKNAEWTARQTAWEQRKGQGQGNQPSEYLALQRDREALQKDFENVNTEGTAFEAKRQAFTEQLGAFNQLVQQQHASADAVKATAAEAKAALQQHTAAFTQALQGGPRQRAVAPEFPGPTIPVDLLKKFQPVAPPQPPPPNEPFRLAKEQDAQPKWAIGAGKDPLTASWDAFRAGLGAVKGVATGITGALGEQIAGPMKGHEQELPDLGERLLAHGKMILEGHGAEIYPADLFGNPPDTTRRRSDAERAMRAQWGMPDEEYHTLSRKEQIADEVGRRGMNIAANALMDPTMYAAFGAEGLAGELLAGAFAADGVRSAVEVLRDPKATAEDVATAVIAAAVQGAPLATRMAGGTAYMLGKQMRAGILAAKLQFPEMTRQVGALGEAGTHAPAAFMEHVGGSYVPEAYAGPPLNLPDMIRFALSDKDLSAIKRGESKPSGVTIPRDMLPGSTVQTPNGGTATVIATETPTHGIPSITVRAEDGSVGAYRPDVLKITAPVPVDLLPPGEIIGRVVEATSMGKGVEATQLKDGLLQRIGRVAASPVQMPDSARAALQAIAAQHPDDVGVAKLRDAFQLIQAVMPEAAPARPAMMPPPRRPQAVKGAPGTQQWVEGQTLYIQFQGRTFSFNPGDPAPTEVPADVAPTPPPAAATPTQFTTSQGSQYAVDGHGTSRNKVRTGEQYGPSDRTVYLDPEAAARAQAHIESFNTGETTARPQITADGQVAIVVKDRATGKVRSDLTRRVAGSPTPAVGLHPFEVWNKTATGDRRWHFGNAITAVGATAPSAPDALAALQSLGLTGEHIAHVAPLPQNETELVDAHGRPIGGTAPTAESYAAEKARMAALEALPEKWTAAQEAEYQSLKQRVKAKAPQRSPTAAAQGTVPVAPAPVEPPVAPPVAAPVVPPVAAAPVVPQEVSDEELAAALAELLGGGDEAPETPAAEGPRWRAGSTYDQPDNPAADVLPVAVEEQTGRRVAIAQLADRLQSLPPGSPQHDKLAKDLAARQREYDDTWAELDQHMEGVDIKALDAEAETAAKAYIDAARKERQAEEKKQAEEKAKKAADAKAAADKKKAARKAEQTAAPKAETPKAWKDMTDEERAASIMAELLGAETPAPAATATSRPATSLSADDVRKQQARAERARLIAQLRKDRGDDAADEGPQHNRPEGFEDAAHQRMDLEVNKERLLDLMGARMYEKPILEVATKELVQNAFDAVRQAGATDEHPGHIRIDLTGRKLTVTDDGIGMTPAILQKAFFTIAGTHKEGKPENTSGGLGLAKMAFLLGSDKVRVETTRDGKTSIVEATAKQIRSGEIDVFTQATDRAPGTTVSVWIPETYVNANGETKEIYLSSSGPSFLSEPLIGPVEVTYNNVEFPLGVNTEGYKKDTEFHFDWGTIHVYVNPEKARYPEVKVLSAGLFQFFFYPWAGDDKIPHDMILDVRPKVRTDNVAYPFNNQREGFRGTIKDDVDAMKVYLQRMAVEQQLLDAKDTFSTLRKLPKVDIDSTWTDAELDDLERQVAERRGRLRGAKDGARTTSTVRFTPDSVTITYSDDTTTTIDRMEYVEPSFRADREIDFEKLGLDTSLMDPSSPSFHNNTTATFDDIEGFVPLMTEIGNTLIAFMREFGQKVPNYEELAAEDPSGWFGGISLDKQYRGLNMVKPFRAIWLNPVLLSSDAMESPAGAASELLHLIIHEITHVRQRNEGAGFTAELATNYGRLRSHDVRVEYFEETLGRILRARWEALEDAHGRLSDWDTKNRGTSFKSSSAAGGDPGRADDRGPGAPELDAAVPERVRGSGRSGDRGTEAADQSTATPLGEILGGEVKAPLPRQQDVLAMVRILRTYEDEGLTDFAEVARTFQDDYGTGARGLDQALEIAWRQATGARVSVADALGAPVVSPPARPRRNAVASSALEDALSPKAQAGVATMFKSWDRQRDLRHIREAMEIYQALVDRAEDGDDDTVGDEQAAQLAQRLLAAAEAYFTKTGPARAVSEAAYAGLQHITGEEDPDWNQLLENEVYASAREAGDLVFNTLDPKTAEFDIEEFNTAYGEVEFRRDPHAVFPNPAEQVNLWQGRKGRATISHAAGEAQIAEWQAAAKAEGATPDNENYKKVVISLYDRTGIISQPWADAGYSVRRFDIRQGEDLTDFGTWMDEIEAMLAQGYTIVGVLAQPPCTSFTVSGAQHWPDKHDAPNHAWLVRTYGEKAAEHFDTPTDYANTLVAVVKLVVAQANPRFYAMENPVGRIGDQNNLPAPVLKFNPDDFGEPYTKATQLWGEFNPNLPTARVHGEKEGGGEGSRTWNLSSAQKDERSLTPVGFAYAFFMANQKLAAGDWENSERPAGEEPDRPYVAERPDTSVGLRELEAPRERERDEPPPVIAFRSGNQTSQVDTAAFIKAGQDVGVTALGMTKPVRAQIVAHVDGGGKAFIDSGAFGKTEIVDGKGRSTINFDAVLSVYDNLAIDVGDATGLFVVAPDVAPVFVDRNDRDRIVPRKDGVPRSFPDETKAIQEKYGDRIQGLIDGAVNVVVPVQVGPTMAARAVEVLHEFRGAMIGLPGNHGAISDDQLTQMLAAMQKAAEEPSGFHFLGIGEKNKRLDHLVAMVRAVFPDAQITSDASRANAMFAEGRPAQEQVKARIGELAEEQVDEEWESDTTELVGSFFRGEFDTFTGPELAQLAAALNIAPSILRARGGNGDAVQKAVDKSGLEDALMLAIYQIAKARGLARKGNKAQARGEVITARDQKGAVSQPPVSREIKAKPNAPVKGQLATTWMNEGSIEQAVERFKDHPVLGPATRFLDAFKDQVNSHSDGWPYWSVASKSAGKLQALIYGHLMAGMGAYPRLPEATAADVLATMPPIKAFMTKRGTKAGIVLPALDLPTAKAAKPASRPAVSQPTAAPVGKIEKIGGYADQNVLHDAPVEKGTINRRVAGVLYKTANGYGSRVFVGGQLSQEGGPTDLAGALAHLQRSFDNFVGQEKRNATIPKRLGGTMPNEDETPADRARHEAEANDDVEAYQYLLDKKRDDGKYWDAEDEYGLLEAALTAIEAVPGTLTAMSDATVRDHVAGIEDARAETGKYELSELDSNVKGYDTSAEVIDQLERILDRDLKRREGQGDLLGGIDVQAPAQAIDEDSAAARPEGETKTAEEVAAAAPDRAKYPDGRLIPQTGDQVYQTVPGFGGTPAFIRGEVYEGRKQELRVRMTGSASFIGGASSSVGKTQKLNPHWVVVGDPEIQRRRDAREQAEKDRRAQDERDEADARAEMLRKTTEAIAGGHAPLTRETPVGSKVVSHFDGETGTLTEQHAEYGPLIDDRTIGDEQPDGTWAGYSVVPELPTRTAREGFRTGDTVRYTYQGQERTGTVTDPGDGARARIKQESGSYVDIFPSELIPVNFRWATKATPVPEASPQAAKSWKAEMQAVAGDWASNGLRFATQKEAEASGQELLDRWSGAKDTRAVETTDPVTHRFDFDAYKNVRLEDAPAAAPAAVSPWRVGDRVTSWDGTGTIAALRDDAAQLHLDHGQGRGLSKWVSLKDLKAAPALAEKEADAPTSTPPVSQPPTPRPTEQKLSDLEREKAQLELQTAEQIKKIKALLKRTTMNAPLDPELLMAVAGLVNLYVKQGIVEFKAAAVRFRADFGVNAQAERAFEQAWPLMQEVAKGALLKDAKATIKAQGQQPTVADAVAAYTEEQGAHDGGREEAAPDGPLAGGEEGQPGSQRPGGRRPHGARGEAGARPGTEEGTQSGSGAGDGERGTVPGPGRDSGLTPQLYTITDADQIGTGSKRERVARNLAAIRIAKLLAVEQRPATPDEQRALVRYVGWGGLKRIFEPWKYDEDDPDQNERKAAEGQYWRAQHETLTNLLTPEEYKRARNSTQNAHYTSPMVIKAMWAAVQRLGVTHGSALEPSAGIGHFVGLMPPELRGALTWALVEKDALTAQIATALYPGAYTQNSGFEAAALPDNHFAVGISNVPFGNIPITDRAFQGPAFVRNRIHNYFFGKGLDKIATGGLEVFVTSHGTMDATDNTGQRVREYLASRADLLGAIRLPFTAFHGNAGTDVVTDILFLRKRAPGETPNHAGPWMQAPKLEGLQNRTGETFAHPVNEYFVAHPEMVLGRHTATGKMREENAYNVEPTGDLATQLAEAIARLPEGVIDLAPKGPTLDAFTDAQPPPGTRPFELLIHEGRVAQVVDGKVTLLPDLSAADEARIRGLLPIRAALRALYDLMPDADASNAAVEAAQAELNRLYDAFVKKHGAISEEQNWEPFHEDPDFALLLSLEDYDAERGKATKTAVFTTRTMGAERAARTADTPAQALQLVLGERGRIDFDRAGELLGVSAEEATRQLADAGLVIETPSGWQLPGQYLAGNVRVKLAEAEAAAKLDPRYEPAVARLKTVIPADVEAYKINVRLGATWVPVDVMTQFVAHVVNTTPANLSWTLTLSPLDAKWGIEGVGRSHESTFATPDVDTKTLLLAAMNDRRIVVKMTIPNPRGEGTIKVVNPQATTLARQRREDLHTAFSEWLFNADHTRRDWAVRTYNDRFNAHVEPRVDGSYLTFPGMAQYWRDRIRWHQRDGIARGLQFGNTLAAWVVGAGKSLWMAGIGMELRRLGLARKPLYVVPNHLISQAPSEFLQYYPKAKLLVARPEDLDKDNRKRFTARIASGDWDGVMMPVSTFVRLSMSVEAETAYQQELMDEIETAIIQAWRDEQQAQEGTGRRQSQRDSRKPPAVAQLENMRDRIQVKLDKLAARPKDDMLTFEQLGVDALVIDEAHLFKNLYFHTRQQAAGIPSGHDGRQRATDLYLKARYINQRSNYRNVFLATGTPVSNSMAEIYVMQKLLQEQVLKQAGIESFDGWLQQFGLITVQPELDPSGTGVSNKTRLTDFRNLPDLGQMFRQVADIKMVDDLPEIKAARPPLETGEPEIVAVPATARQLQYLAELAHRAENLDPRKRHLDNMAVITQDGRASSLDQRLINRTEPDDPASKINRVVSDAAGILNESKKQKGVILIFMDAGTPGSEVRPAMKEVWDPDVGERVMRPLTPAERLRGFELYADIKRKLIASGAVKAAEVAFIHDVDKVPKKQRDAARATLFRKVRAGEIRVLLGSSNKMATGMNVQDRLVAELNVDPTYKPSETEQRYGRILRQGNRFATPGYPEYDPDFKVRILNYVTQGRGEAYGMDAVMWQLNEAKAKFIADFYKGKLEQRDARLDLDSTVLTAGHIKAIATGNPLIIEQAKAAAEVDRLRLVHAGWQDEVREARWKLGSATQQAAFAEVELASLRDLGAVVTPRGDTMSATIGDETLDGPKAIGEKILAAVKVETQANEGHPGLYLDYYNPKQLGTIQGLDLWLVGNKDREPILVLRHPDDPPERYQGATAGKFSQRTFPLFAPSTEETARGGLDWRNPQSMAQAIDRDIQSIPAMIRVWDDDLRVNTEKAANYQKVLTRGFSQQAEYDRARARLDEINRALGVGDEDEVMQPAAIEDDDTRGGGDEASEGDYIELPPTPGRVTIPTAGGGQRTVTLHPVEFPEMVDLARELQTTPHVVRRFRTPGTRGMFGMGGIRLHKDLFKTENLRQLAATLAHEIGHLADWLPDYTLKRGNLLGRIRSLSSFLKSQYSSPDGTIIKNSVVRAELLKLSAKWRPWDEEAASEAFRRYRRSSKELYADALSVLLNNPGLAQEEAPVFFKGFFEELDAKVEVKRAFFSLWEQLSGTREELIARRLAGVEGMFSLANTRSVDLLKLKVAERNASLKDYKQHLWGLMGSFVDKHAPFIQRLEADKARGARVAPKDNPFFALSERTYRLAGTAKAWLQTDVQPILDRLAQHDLAWARFGEILMYERIVAGDRSEIGNPRGLQVDAAQELLDARLKEMTPTQRAVIRTSLDAFRAAVKRIAKEAYDAGLFTKETWDAIEANPAYATFRTIEHLADPVSSRIHHQIGTLKDIANPADSTVLKTLATLRAIEHQRVKQIVFRYLESMHREDIQDAKVIDGRPIPPHDHDLRLVTYFERGKLKGKYVDPVIAQSLENANPWENEWIVKGMAWVNSYFKKAFTTYNPGFQAYNLRRDFKRFWRNMPGMTRRRALARYWQARHLAAVRTFGLASPEASKVRQAYRTLTGKPATAPTPAERQAWDDLIAAEKAGILGTTYREHLGYDIDEQMIVNILAHAGVGTFEKQHYAVTKPVFAVLDAIASMGDFIETLPKAAGMYEAKGDGGIADIPPDVRQFIRAKVGSPDYLAGGTLKPILNQLLLFYNAITQGMRSDLEVATAPTTRSGFWWKTIQSNFLPKLLQMAALMAAAGAMATADDATNPVVRELQRLLARIPWLVAAGRVLRKIPEYDLTQYIIVPLGVDAHGNAVAVRIPQDDTGRFLGGIFWKALGAAKGDRNLWAATADVLSYTGGQVPSQAPIFSAGAAAAQYASGNNPYDPFRQRHVLTDDEQKLRGLSWDPFKKFAGWEFQQVGGNVIYKFYTGDDRPKQEPGSVIFQLPVVGDFAGRFVRVTKGGEKERNRAAGASVDAQMALRRNTEQEAINTALNRYWDLPAWQQTIPTQERMAADLAKQLYPGERDEKKKDAITRRLKARMLLSVVHGEDDALAEPVLSAETNAEKTEIILRARQNYTSEQFEKWLYEAVRQHVISPQVRIDVRKRMQRPTVH